MFQDIQTLTSQSGIYLIKSPTGKIYIGEASNLRVRCSYYLNPNRVKKQRAIYNSLIKYGVEKHSLVVLEFCDTDNLLEKERYYQEFYNSVDNGLNCFYTPTKSKKKLHSQETINAMSKKAIGVNNGFYGKKHTSDSIKKIKESSAGAKNPNYGGKLHNAEYLQKQSDSNSKVPIKVIDTHTGIETIYKNSKEVSLALDAKSSNVRTCKSAGHKLLRRYIIQDLLL
jgi:group I intron endonuclease